MTLQCGISQITFVNGHVEDLPTDGIVVLVGPNNVGKTLALRDIDRFLFSNPGTTFSRGVYIVDSIKLEKRGDNADLTEWMQTHGRPLRRHPNGQLFYGNYARLGVSQDQGTGIWGADTFSLGALGKPLISTQFAETRLQLVNQSEVHNLDDESPEHPLQRIYMDEALEQKLSDLTYRAFGYEVCINRYLQRIELRLGRPTLTPTPPPPSEELLEEYRRLPLLSEQGDGVKSFVGLLLHTVVPSQIMVLIDEPEAFLHPPQARLLGKILASDTPEPSQVIVATHSQDFLQGLLESPKRRIKIIRITRNADDPEIMSLEPERVRLLWSDAQIRYSNLLDGLFHSGVVICESDADCKYYEASTDASNMSGRDHDFLFTHVGGKARMPKSLEELAKFGIRSCAIADLDLLNDENLVQRTVRAVGGNWSDFERDMRIVSSAVEGLGSIPLVRTVLDDIETELGSERARLMTRADSAKIGMLAKTRTGWEQLKLSGISGMPQGDGSEAIRRLISNLAGIGIFLVPVGELERWHPDISGKSSAWVAKVLEDGLHAVPNQQRDEFLSVVIEFFLH